MGSTITGELINARTDTDALFVTDSADTPVVVDHDVRVDSIAVGNASYPSVGKVSAYAEGLIMEGRGNNTKMYQTIEWSEETSVDGDIYLFDKDMHYESGVRRVRET